jgi:predicted dehydrogenase
MLTAERGYANISELKIAGARDKEPLRSLTVPEKYWLAPENLPVPAANVAALYTQFARDLADGTTLAPDFNVAIRRHQLVDAIEKSNITGTRQALSFKSAN